MIGLLIAAALAAADPVRTLIVTGGHDHHPAFYSLFDDAALKPNVNPHPNAFNSDMRKNYDVLVLYDMVRAAPEGKRRENLQAFVEAGKGIVVLHHALCGYVDWPWWSEQVVGARYRFAPETPLSTFKHDEPIAVELKKAHPVTAGLRSFTLTDETYKSMWFSPKIDVLMSTANSTSDGPLVWLGLHAKSRVVVIQLGHGPQAFRDANYRRLVKNAIEWAAGAGAMP